MESCFTYFLSYQNTTVYNQVGEPYSTPRHCMKGPWWYGPAMKQSGSACGRCLCGAEEWWWMRGVDGLREERVKWNKGKNCTIERHCTTKQQEDQLNQSCKPQSKPLEALHLFHLFYNKNKKKNCHWTKRIQLEILPSKKKLRLFCIFAPVTPHFAELPK